MAIDWHAFEEVLRGAHRFIITSHVRPDCDALGSELAMDAWLRRLGKQTLICNSDPTPASLRFIDPDHRIQSLPIEVEPYRLNDHFGVGPFDVLLIVDTSSWNQIGRMAAYARDTNIRVAVLDHHQTEDNLGHDVFKDATVEATGRLIMDGLAATRTPLYPEMATPLFAALATDTGWFRYPSVNEGTYRAAAKLIEAGAEPYEIYRTLFEQESIAALKLQGRALDRLVFERGGRLAHSYLLRSDYQELSATTNDADNLVNQPLRTPQVQVAVFFSELPDNSFKVSLRSRGSFDCSRLAELLGGGGHQNAAGVRLEGDLESVRKLALDSVRAAMED